METTIYYYTVRGFLQIIISVFGIIGNSISAVVLTRPGMSSAINVTLLGLALADNIYLVSRALLDSLLTCLQYFNLHYSYQHLFHPFIASPGIFWNTVGKFSIQGVP